MTASLGWLLLLAFQVGLALAVLRWRRVLAGPVLLLSGVLWMYLVGSIIWEWSFPYRLVSIYIVFFAAVIFTFTGMLAVAARLRDRR